MKRYIYIFVEVAQRELDSRLAIAIKLAKEGFEVVIGEKNQLLWNIFAGKYPPGVIFDKCAQIAEHKKFESLIKRGFIYTVLDEEGLLTDKNYFNKNRFSKNAEKFVSANFVTGDNLNSIILSEYPTANNIISGNPRYSMLHKEWDTWFAYEMKSIQEQYGKFALIVSSFNPYPQAYLYALPGMKEVDEFFKHKMEEYLSNNQTSDLSFILRPHPSDQPYGYTGVNIDSRFNIIPWIRAADFIVNAKCTTSLEAFIAGKPVFTWKYRTNEKLYKLANIFANDINDMGSIEPDSYQKRRSKILEKLLAHYGSAFEPLNIITQKIGELSFPVKEKKPNKISIHRMMHFRNRVKAFIRGDDYNRILQKFTAQHLQYALDKAKYHGLQIEEENFVLTLKN